MSSLPDSIWQCCSPKQRCPKCRKKIPVGAPVVSTRGIHICVPCYAAEEHEAITTAVRTIDIIVDDCREDDR